MIGVQTIGNATLTAYDQKPILSTDPWMGRDSYPFFGSWQMPYDIPNNIREDIIKSEHKIAYLETVIKYIDGVLRSIQNRGWDIKNAISWKQFEAGMI